MKKADTCAFAGAAMLVASVLLGPVAHAQAKYFEGFSLGLGATSANTTTERSFNAPRDSTNADNNAVVQAQYSLALGDSFALGMGGTANLNDLKAGNTGGFSHTLKNGYSLFAAPGYAVSNMWLGYLKLAYLNADLQSSPGTTQNFDNGYGYGLGVQAMFTKQWFGQFEFMADQYPERNLNPGTTISLKSNIFSLTAGYKF